MRRRWGRTRKVLLICCAISAILFGILAAKTYAPYGQTSSHVLSAVLCLISALATFMCFITPIVASTHVIETIQPADSKYILKVVYLTQGDNGTFRSENIELHINEVNLFYSPHLNGTFLRENNCLLISDPDGFALWHAYLEKNRNEFTRNLGHPPDVAKIILPPASPQADSQLALNAARCPVCNDPFTAGHSSVLCAKCRTPHHKDCWGEAGKCATYACGSKDFTHAAS